jgi:hypothetical protein
MDTQGYKTKNIGTHWLKVWFPFLALTPPSNYVFRIKHVKGVMHAFQALYLSTHLGLCCPITLCYCATPPSATTQVIKAPVGPWSKAMLGSLLVIGVPSQEDLHHLMVACLHCQVQARNLF